MFLDPVFGFLLVYNPIIAVTIFALIILIFINIFYRILINQTEAKQLKDRVKELNKEMKEAQKAGNRDEMNKVLSEVMRQNSKLMKMSMKPMIISFIIVIIFLPWLAGAYGDQTIGLQNDTGTMNYQGTEYLIAKSGSNITITYANQVKSCASTCMQNLNGTNFEITDQGASAKFSPVIALMPVPLPIFGNTLGWLGWYILVSIPLVILIRRFMKINV